MKATKSKPTPILAAMLGKKVVFDGKFDWGEQDRLTEMTQAQAGAVVADLDAKTDYLVLADATKGKTIQKQVASLNAKGASVQVLDKTVFLNLVQPTKDQIIRLIRQGKQNAALFIKAFGSQKVHFVHFINRGSMPGMDIVAENFDGLDLSGFKFLHVQFQSCSFVNTTFTDGVCTSAIDCDFSGTVLDSNQFGNVTRSRFVKSRMEKTKFQGSIEDADFTGANLTGAGFFQQPHRGLPARAAGAKFNSASLNSAAFRYAELRASDFSHADLSAADFESCYLASANFTSAKMAAAKVMASTAVDANFSDADLTGADFSETELSGARMDGADLKDASFAAAKLDRVDFSKAKNYTAEPTAAGSAGPAVAELDNLAQQARRIQFEVQIQRGTDAPQTIGVDTPRLKWGWGVSFNNAYGVRRPSLNTVTAALLYLGGRIGQSKVRYETLEVKSTKSPKAGKELREIVIKALAEAFSQPIPPAEELAAATKAFRDTTSEKESAAREARKKEKELAELKKAAEKKQIAKKIEKQVGKVTDIATFLKALELRADKSKIDKATKMLKAEKFQLFNDITETHLNGVVKSQTDADLVYACRIESNGQYACCTQNLNICGGLRGSICKHLLVLIIGLVKAGQLDPGDIDAWIAKTHDTKPELNKETMGEIFIRYKGAEAGEVDWRPTETVPEDYYAV